MIAQKLRSTNRLILERFVDKIFLVILARNKNDKKSVKISVLESSVYSLYIHRFLSCVDSDHAQEK